MYYYLDLEFSIQLYLAPDCPQCARALLMARQIAIESKAWVQSQRVEASQNVDLARQLNLTPVPPQVTTGELDTVAVGIQQETGFVNDVLRLVQLC
jgi:hypothetical protein